MKEEMAVLGEGGGVGGKEMEGRCCLGEMFKCSQELGGRAP